MTELNHVIALFISFNNILEAKAAKMPIKTVPIVPYEIGCPYAVILIGMVYRYFNIATLSFFGIMLYNGKY